MVKSVSNKKLGFRAAIGVVTRFMIGFASMMLLSGFLAFALHVSRASPPDPLPQADGIVVLTGKGGGRLATGAELLKAKYGERLLISGVNPANSTDKIKSLLAIDTGLFDCCVDLDYEARNTYANAQQTAQWVKALGYDRIILVTSAYHMPRAKLELRAAMDEVAIIPYPVKPAHTQNTPWWGGKVYWSRLAREYGKLLVSFVRDPGARPTP